MQNYRLIFGSSEHCREFPDSAVYLVVSSPPDFNAPFDCSNLFPSDEAYLETM